jgi:TolB protein
LPERFGVAAHLLLFVGLLIAAPWVFAQQPQARVETHGGDVAALRLGVADFKTTAADSQTGAFRSTFDTTLYNDLNNAGIFDMVSKSIAPQVTPGGPSEISLNQWSMAPVSAAMVAFGSIGVSGNRLAVNGYLDDVKNTQYPQVFARVYNEDATLDSARQIAHRFADEIISRLGGGINGICETKIYFVHAAGGTKEIWEMDYDGANQHPVTHLGKISISPRVSPDNSRLAFTTLDDQGFHIQMYSLLLGRMVTFPVGGSTITPAWNPNGKEIAYAAAPNGDFDIWVSDVNGSLARKITNFPGPDVSPVYNPRTGSQIAWIRDYKGLPQLFIMGADGSGVQRLTDMGYASSPSWSPNGQFIAFSWNRKYGPGAPGGQDIYIIEIATGKWVQLTHEIGQCDFPSFSPDGRHIVFANSPDGRIGHMKIYSMLTDGTGRIELTHESGNDMPNWSWK